MYKWAGFLFSCLFILSGCMSLEVDNKDDDVVAVVRGEEITLGDMRILYPDEAIETMIDEVVKAKLAEQEVKKMNIDASDHIKKLIGSYGQYPEEDEQSVQAQSIRAFADPQAKKLGMDPNEYYRMYIEKATEMVGYMNAYTSFLMGELGEDELGVEEYVDHANQVLEDLVAMNMDGIEIKN